jgi:hypothetical protein
MNAWANWHILGQPDTSSRSQYWIMTRSLFNRQQHPPFYASMRRYRGW